MSMHEPHIERELDAIDDALAGRPVEPELTELGALALELREDRPQPSEGFGRALDDKVARGFGVGSLGRRRWQRAATYLPAAAAAAVTVLVVSLAVLAGGGSDDESGGGASKAARGSGDDATGALGGSSQERRADPSVAPAAPAPSPRSDREQSRKVERTAALTLATPPDEFDRVADEIVRVTDALGGYVLSSNVSSNDRDGGEATYELRVPGRSQQRALADLSRLGHVRERSQSAVDITRSFVSARERVNDARAERESLLRQLADADTPNETRSIRERLRDASSRLAVAKRDLDRVSNRASFSTIAVTLRSDRGAGDDEGAWSPSDAFDDAMRILEIAAGVLMIAAAVLLPLALLLAIARAASRRTVRLRRERALEA